MGIRSNEAALRGRIGAYCLHATHDPRQTTANARRSFLDSFEKQVDPDGALPPEERQRRALAARRAHFTRLALRSAQKRSSRKKKTADARGTLGEVS